EPHADAGDEVVEAALPLREGGRYDLPAPPHEQAADPLYEVVGAALVDAGEVGRGRPVRPRRRERAGVHTHVRLPPARAGGRQGGQGGGGADVEAVGGVVAHAPGAASVLRG